MNVPLDTLLDKVTHFIQDEAKTETVIGKQFKLGEFYCIPVIRTGMGFGTGGGEGEDQKHNHGEGAMIGGGIGIEPIGFLVSKGDNVQFISTKTNKGLAAAFEKVPALMEKYFEMKKEEEPVPA